MLSGIARLALSGYVVYTNPTDTHKKMFADSVSDVLLHPYQWTSPLDERATSSLDCKNDTLATNDDPDEVRCKVCTTNKRCIVLLPCEHSSTCISCYKSISRENNKCPICRQEITDTIFYYTS